MWTASVGSQVGDSVLLSKCKNIAPGSREPKGCIRDESLTQEKDPSAFIPVSKELVLIWSFPKNASYP